MDPVTIGIGVMAGKTIGSTIAGWITPNKSPWERYKEKIGWIAGSKPPGALNDKEIRSIVHSAPTLGADLSTMNSAQDSSAVQMTALKDNRAVVESVSNTLHGVNANLRLMDAKARLSDSLMALQGSTQQAEMTTSWKKGLMGIAAERGIDEWEAKNEKISQIGGLIGMGAAAGAMGGYALLKGGAEAGFAGTLASTSEGVGLSAPAFGAGVAGTGVAAGTTAAALPLGTFGLSKMAGAGAMSVGGDIMGEFQEWLRRKNAWNAMNQTSPLVGLKV